MNASHEDVAESTSTTEAAMRPQSVPVNVYEASEALVVVAPLPAVTAATSRRAAPRRPVDDAVLGPRAQRRAADLPGPRVGVRRLRAPDRPADGYGRGVEASLHNGQLVVRVLRGDPAEALTVTPT